MISIICITKTVFICIFTGYLQIVHIRVLLRPVRFADLFHEYLYEATLQLRNMQSRADNLLQPGDNKPPEAGTGEW